MAEGKHAAFREVRRGRTLVVLTVVAMLAGLLVAVPGAVAAPGDLADFEAGLPAGWFTFSGGASAVTGAKITVGDTDGLARPSQVGNNGVLQVDFTNSDFAGFGVDFSGGGSQDWSTRGGLGFWFRGMNSGLAYQVEVYDNRSDPTTDTAERFEVVFVDDIVGWRQFSIPFSNFNRAIDFQPGGAPDDGFTLTEIWGWSIVLPLGVGTVYFDDFDLQDHPAPMSVTVAGNLQSELGCGGDWQPDCAETHLGYHADDTVWQGTFAVPAGGWEYKAALNDSWDENYGANATRDGPNIPLSLGADTDVKFYYDDETHWVTDNVNSVIATVPGSYQSELGCPGDWQPDCLRSWLQDPDGDGTYTFSTTAIPAGSHEVKVTIDESWDENYGAGGVPNGPNILFMVMAPNSTVSFSYDPVTHILSVTVSGPPLTSVTVVGDFQSELGCSGDWQPDCAATHLTYDGTGDVWQGVFAVPAGNWEYKVALNDSWFENYGAGGVQNGPNIPLFLSAPTAVKFVYDHETHLVTLAPNAADDAYTTDEDTTLTVAAPGVLGNDTDVNGDPLQGAGWTWYEPFGGTANVYLDGSFQFVPDPNFCGESVWIYKATDGVAESDWATVTITVTCVNDPPVADANGPYVGTIGVPVSFDGTGSSDPENAVLTFDWDFGDGSPPGTDAGPIPAHTYATAAMYTVTLTVTDDGGLTDTASTTATITLGSGSFDAVEATIEGMGIEPGGIEKSLLKKIQNAQKSFDKADGEACDKLASFIAAVNAQDGKKLTTQQADLLRSQAEAISDAYGCNA